jgi:hypothetical protein
VRSIKFRAWDGKKMNENVVIVDGDAYKRGYFGNIFNPDAKAGEPMQFTGLKDNNGQEIYEGDVVRDNDSLLWKVFFEDGCFLVNGGEYGLIEHLIELAPLFCEVIGNKFEHQHLLKEA